MITNETIAKLKAEHGDDLHLLEGAGHEIVVRVPSRAEWKRFRAQQADAAKNVDARETLLRGCIVHPAAADVAAIFEKRPGLVDTFGVELQTIAGVTAEATSRKL